MSASRIMDNLREHVRQRLLREDVRKFVHFLEPPKTTIAQTFLLCGRIPKSDLKWVPPQVTRPGSVGRFVWHNYHFTTCPECLRLGPSLFLTWGDGMAVGRPEGSRTLYWVKEPRGMGEEETDFRVGMPLRPGHLIVQLAGPEFNLKTPNRSE